MSRTMRPSPPALRVAKRAAGVAPPLAGVAGAPVGRAVAGADDAATVEDSSHSTNRFSGRRPSDLSLLAMRCWNRARRKKACATLARR
jgi:hypothetical protein